MPEAASSALSGVREQLGAAIEGIGDRTIRRQMGPLVNALDTAVNDRYRSRARLLPAQANRSLKQFDHFVIQQLPRQVAIVIRLIEAGQVGKAYGELGDLVGEIRRSIQ